jgi:hypothetical protein
MHTSTSFQFTLTEPAAVKLDVVDAVGKSIFLKDYGTRSAGRNTIEWNTSEANQTLSGIYFYRLQTGSKKYDGKLLIRQE